MRFMVLQEPVLNRVIRKAKPTAKSAGFWLLHGGWMGEGEKIDAFPKDLRLGVGYKLVSFRWSAEDPGVWM